MALRLSHNAHHHTGRGWGLVQPLNVIVNAAHVRNGDTLTVSRLFFTTCLESTVLICCLSMSSSSHFAGSDAIGGVSSCSTAAYAQGHYEIIPFNLAI